MSTGSRTGGDLAALRAAAISLTAAAVLAAPMLAPTPAAAACILDCWTVTAHSNNHAAISVRAGDTSTGRWLYAGQKRTTHGGAQFWVPTGCRAKTSTLGRYWAGPGWHESPRHRVTVNLTGRGC